LALVAATPRSVLVFYLLFALVGVTAAAQSPVSYVKAISAWLDQRRGLGIGVALAGVGIGTAVLPQYTQALLEQFGWRGAVIGLAVLLAVVALPPALIWIREPEPFELVVAGEGRSAGSTAVAPRTGLSLRQTLRTSQFWVLAVSTLIVSTAVHGGMVHIVPMLTDRGVSPAAAASVLIVAGIASLVGRLLSGYLIDRLFAPYVGAVAFLLPCVGFALLGTGTSAAAGVILIGLAVGAEMDMISFMTSRYFGLRRLGQIYGVTLAVFAVGTALGPLLFSLSFDNLGGYEPAMWASGAALVVASASCLFLGPYAYPSGAPVAFDPRPTSPAAATEA
jgi:predicted MFS family arabinose efflux permease